MGSKFIEGLPPNSKFTGTYLNTWMKRGTVRVKCIAQEHNAAPRPSLEPGPFTLESSALTIRPQGLTLLRTKCTRTLAFRHKFTFGLFLFHSVNTNLYKNTSTFVMDNDFTTGEPVFCLTFFIKGLYLYFY